jgi:hypothetical protein
MKGSGLLHPPRSHRWWGVRALLLASAVALAIGLLDYEPAPVCIQVAGADCPSGDSGGIWFLVSGLSLILGCAIALFGRKTRSGATAPPVSLEARNNPGLAISSLGLLAVLSVGITVWSALTFGAVTSDDQPQGVLISWAIGVAVALGGIVAAYRARTRGDRMLLPWAWFAVIIALFAFVAWLFALASPYFS